MFLMGIQIVRMLPTWTNCPTSFILCIRCLLKTWMCICTDTGRTFSKLDPASSSVWGQACLGGVEMFSFMLLCSGWGTLMTVSQFSDTVKHYKRQPAWWGTGFPMTAALLALQAPWVCTSGTIHSSQEELPYKTLGWVSPQTLGIHDPLLHKEATSGVGEIKRRIFGQALAWGLWERDLKGKVTRGSFMPYASSVHESLSPSFTSAPLFLCWVIHVIKWFSGPAALKQELYSK